MSFEISKAMVLAAGRGTRMRSLTDDLPKPLIQVHQKTLIDYVFDNIIEQNIHDVVVNLCYLGEKIKKNCQKRKELNFSFSYEQDALETGGGVKKALPLLDTPAFFVINSDPLWTNGETPALKRMEQAWNPNESDILLLLVPKERAIGHDGLGDYFVRKGKPVRKTNPNEEAPYIFAGIQILKASVFDDSPEGKFRLVPLYDKAQAQGRLSCVIHDGDWFHVGTPEALALAEEKFSAV